MKKLALLALIITLVLSTVSSATMLREVWYQSLGIDDAIALANGDTPPDQVDILADSAWPDMGIDNYVGKMSGYVVVPATGDYTFYVSSDDNSRLYVSQDTDPANAVQVAFVDEWTNAQEWGKYDSQKAEPMSLTEGQVMAVYAIMQEGTGGDNLAIGWTGPGIDDISLLGANASTNPFQATCIAPADGATGVVDVVAEWMAPLAGEAPVYNVYGGTDPEALDLLAEGITETSLPYGSAGAELDYETTYYWRVDVVGQEPGDVWSFTTETARPVITATQDDVVMPGEDAQLAVEATSLAEGELTYQWYRAEVEMMGIVLTDVPLPEGVAAVLDVTAATAADEGDYYCVVTNEFGSTTSPIVILDVQTGLIHRWTFNDTLADEVGGADAVLVNNTGNAAIVDGQAVMGNVGTELNDNNDGDYIDLPNGLISKLSQMTIQVWATYTDQDLRIWSRVLSFGSSDAGEDRSPGGGSSTYVTVQPNRSGNIAGYEFRNRGAVTDVLVESGGRIALDEEIQYTLVWDDINSVTKLYLNGVPQCGALPSVTLKEFDDVNMWLGRGQWNDPLFIGSFNEARMYDTALTAEEVAVSYLAGPDELPVLPERCALDLAGDMNKDCLVDIIDAAMLADDFLMQSLQEE